MKGQEFSNVNIKAMLSLRQFEAKFAKRQMTMIDFYIKQIYIYVMGQNYGEFGYSYKTNPWE